MAGNAPSAPQTFQIEPGPAWGDLPEKFMGPQVQDAVNTVLVPGIEVAGDSFIEIVNGVLVNFGPLGIGIGIVLGLAWRGYKRWRRLEVHEFKPVAPQVPMQDVIIKKRSES